MAKLQLGKMTANSAVANVAVSSDPAPMAEEKITQVDPVSSEDDPLLTQSDVARLVGKSPQTIGRWINDGLLPFVRQPSGIAAIRKSAIDKFIGATCLVAVHDHAS